MKVGIKTSAWTDVEGFYDNFFFKITRNVKPDLIVELGTYAGHSAACFASALEMNGKGIIECWDLWENYPYNKVPMQEAIDNLDGLPVILRQQDAFEAYKHYLNDSVDILMVDLSNNGDIVRRLAKDWHPIIKKKGKILFEGGSHDRDNVWWMKEFHKPPIEPVLHEDWMGEMYSLVTLTPFPSLTVMEKR